MTATDTTEIASDDSGPAGDRGRRQRTVDAMRSRRRSIVVGVLVVMAAALLVVVGTMIFSQRPNDIAIDDARESAASAASDAVIAMYSYDPTTVDGYLVSATSHLTGDMLSSFTSYAEQYVIPVVTSQNLTMTSAVSGTSVEQASPDGATVLLFMTRSLVTNGGDPQQFQSAVRIEMSEVDGRWLVEKFDPVQ